MLKEKYEFPDTLFVNVNGNKQIVLFFLFHDTDSMLENYKIQPFHQKKNIDSYKV